MPWAGRLTTGRSTARVPDELIPEERLRRLGGKSFYRAHEVIDSARIHDFGYAYTDDGITLTALVDSARRLRRRLQRHRACRSGIGDLTASHCTCPAYGRFGAICKHVIALIMAYDEDPDVFEALDGDSSDPSSAAHPRPPRRSPRTSRRLQAFMREREQSRQSDVQSRQLTLLKEIDAMSSSAGSTGAQQGGRRRIPAPADRQCGPASGTAAIRHVMGGAAPSDGPQPVGGLCSQGMWPRSSTRCGTRGSTPTAASSRSYTPATP